MKSTTRRRPGEVIATVGTRIIGQGLQERHPLALGIKSMAVHGVQGRAVMIDLHAHFGNTHKLVGYDSLMRVIEADGVVVEAGDMLCLHIGFAQLVLGVQKTPDPAALHHSCFVLDGRF